MMKTPYVDVGRTAEAFPYYCNTGLITDAELSIIVQQLNAFYQLLNTHKQKNNINDDLLQQKQLLEF